MPLPADSLGSFSFTAASQTHADHAFLVDVFAIIVTYKLDHLIIRNQRVDQRVGDGLFQHHRVFDGDLVVQSIGSGPAHALSDVHLFAVRHPLVALHRWADADGVDHQRIAIPMPDGVAVIAWRSVVE